MLLDVSETQPLLATRSLGHTRIRVRTRTHTRKYIQKGRNRCTVRCKVCSLAGVTLYHKRKDVKQERHIYLPVKKLLTF